MWKFKNSNWYICSKEEIILFTLKDLYKNGQTKEFLNVPKEEIKQTLPENKEDDDCSVELIWLLYLILILDYDAQ